MSISTHGFLFPLQECKQIGKGKLKKPVKDHFQAFLVSIDIRYPIIYRISEDNTKTTMAVKKASPPKAACFFCNCAN